MGKYEYKDYEYTKVKKKKNLELGCFVKNDKERFYKIKYLVDIKKTHLVKKILDTKNYPENSNNLISDIAKTEKKHVYAYKIYNEILKNLHKVDIECHFLLKQIDENNFKFKNNRLESNQFDDTYYIDINFIHIEIVSIKTEQFEQLEQLDIYFNIDLSMCLFKFDNFWEEIEKFCLGFGNLFAMNKTKS